MMRRRIRDCSLVLLLSGTLGFASAGLTYGQSGGSGDVDTESNDVVRSWSDYQIEAILDFWAQHDSSPATFGRFVGTNTPLLIEDDTLTGLCGSLGARGPAEYGGYDYTYYGRVSGCFGKSDNGRANFVPGAPIEIDQPGIGVQTPIPGGAVFGSTTQTSMGQLRSELGFGKPYVQTDKMLIAGSVLGGIRHTREKRENQLTSNSFPGGFQTTTRQEMKETSFGVGYKAEFWWTPRGLRVPLSGLQAITFAGTGRIYHTEADGSDHFFSNQAAVVLGNILSEFSGSGTTYEVELEANARFGLGNGAALTVGASVTWSELPTVVTNFNGPSVIGFDDQIGVNAFVQFSTPLEALTARQSDARLKREITPLVTLANGLKLYSFKYLWNERVHVGVMAQDLLADEALRHTVHVMPNGYFAVDYNALGLKMTSFERWRIFGPRAISKMEL